jgi:hypothetical protein
MDLDSLDPLPKGAYPEQMLPVDRGIHGLGFYPGARGFPKENSAYGGVMLLGRDWGTKKDYDRFSGWPSRDESGLTWRNTRDVYLARLRNFSVWCTKLSDGRTQGWLSGEQYRRPNRPLSLDRIRISVLGLPSTTGSASKAEGHSDLRSIQPKRPATEQSAWNALRYVRAQSFQLQRS